MIQENKKRSFDIIKGFYLFCLFLFSTFIFQVNTISQGELPSHTSSVLASFDQTSISSTHGQGHYIDDQASWICGFPPLLGVEIFEEIFDDVSSTTAALANSTALYTLSLRAFKPFLDAYFHKRSKLFVIFNCWKSFLV